MSLRNRETPKMERIKAVPMFAKADHTALEHLAGIADEVTVSEGTTLITQGSRHQEGYVVVSGSLAVSIDDEQVATIGVGEMVGELAMFGYGPASATVTAAAETELLVIPAANFDLVLSDNPSLGVEIARELAGRLHDMDARFHHG